MSNLPQWQKDLNDVILPGADIGAYWNIRTFLAQNAELEGTHQARFFEALSLGAKVFKEVGSE